MLKFQLLSFRFFDRRNSHPLTLLYVAMLFLSLHWFLVVYINSSFLGQFMTATQISMLYAAGSCISLICFFYIPTILRSVGNYFFTLFLTALELCALIGMSFADTPTVASIYFLLHFVSIPLLLFTLDIFIETYLGTTERKTGSMRGLYLSLISFAGAISQLLTGAIAHGGETSFVFVYSVSALFLLCFGTIIYFCFKQFKDPKYTLVSIATLYTVLRKNKDTRSIVIISFFLQLFFIWMVIYTPLYLAYSVGLSWFEIGMVMFVGLSAYTLFEWPIGILADRYIGEKEMMAFGFVVIAVSMSWFAFLLHASVLVWMIVMFLTRVGASLVEATTESYFFKHTVSIDTHKISLFRMTTPLAYILGSLLGSVIFLYAPFNFAFIIFSFFMIPGLFFTLTLKDTK